MSPCSPSLQPFCLWGTWEHSKLEKIGPLGPEALSYTIELGQACLGTLDLLGDLLRLQFPTALGC